MTQGEPAHLPTDIHKELLSNASREAALALLRRTFPWHLHITPIANVELIKANGLTPRLPDGFNAARLPEIVTAEIGHGAESVICLSPVGSQKMNVNRAGPTCKLAIETRNLSARIGLDWSYDYPWSLAKLLVSESPNKPRDELFVEVAHRSGSIISYDPIPPESIRILVDTANLEDLATWPLIKELDDKMIVRRFTDVGA